MPRKNRRVDPGDSIVQANRDEVLPASQGRWFAVERNHEEALSQVFREPLDQLDLSQEITTVACAKPRRGRGKWKGMMVYLRRSVTDHVSVFRDETPTIICPQANQARLKTASREASVNKLITLTDVYHCWTLLMA